MIPESWFWNLLVRFKGYQNAKYGGIVARPVDHHVVVVVAVSQLAVTCQSRGGRSQTGVPRNITTTHPTSSLVFKYVTQPTQHSPFNASH